MASSRTVLVVLSCCALAFLLACDNSEDPVNPGTQPVEVSTWALDPGGSSFQMTLGDGSALKIDLPPGAVLSPTTIKVKRLQPTGGNGLAFEIQPSGLILRKTATLTLSLPDGAEFSDMSALGYTGGGKRAILPTVVDLDAGELRAGIRILGYADNAAKSTAVDPVDQLEVVVADCDDDYEAAVTQLEKITDDDYLPETVRPLLDQIAALRIACDGAESNLLAALITEQACQRNADARIDAFNLPPNLSMDQVLEYVRHLIGSQSMLDAIEADCSDVGLTTEAVENVFNTYIDQMVARVDDDAYLETTSWTAAWYQVPKALDIEAEAALVDQDEVFDRVRAQLLPAIMDQLRRAAYRANRQDHLQEYLVDILSGGYLLDHPAIPDVPEVPGFASYGGDDIEADTHLGVTALTIEVYDGDLPPQEIESQRRVLGGGEVMGDHVVEAEITVPANGQIKLMGDVWAFFCPSNDGGGWADQQIRIDFAGEEIARLDHGGDGLFFDGPFPWMMEVGEVLAQLELDPGITYDYDMEVWRVGSHCSELYEAFGVGDYPLAMLTVTVTPGGAELFGDVIVSSQEDVAGLAGVTAVHGHLTIEGDSGKAGEPITDLSMLGSLEAVESLTIKNTYVTDLTGLEKLSASTHESGRLLEVWIEGNTYLQTLAAMTDWPEMGRLWLVNNHDLTDLGGLDGVTTIGQLNISGADDLVSLSGLQSLQIVEDSFGVYNCPSLEVVEHLVSLHTVGGPSIGFGQCAALTTVELPALSNVARRLRFDNNPVLAHVQLGSLVDVGAVSFVNNPVMTSLDGFESLVTIHDDLSLINMASLASLDGLQNLRTISDRLVLRVNPKLATIAALSQTVIVSGFQIQDNDALINLDGLQATGPHDETGSISIRDNDALVSLYGAEGITSCANLAIYDNSSLTSLAGLGLQTIIGDINIVDNGCLDNDLAESYAAGIAVGGLVNVGRNGLDCR